MEDPEDEDVAGTEEQGNGGGVGDDGVEGLLDGGLGEERSGHVEFVRGVEGEEHGVDLHEPPDDVQDDALPAVTVLHEEELFWLYHSSFIYTSN